MLHIITTVERREQVNPENISRSPNHALTIERSFYYVFMLLDALIRPKRGRHVFAISRIPATSPARL